MCALSSPPTFAARGPTTRLPVRHKLRAQMLAGFCCAKVVLGSAFGGPWCNRLAVCDQLFPSRYSKRPGWDTALAGALKSPSSSNNRPQNQVASQCQSEAPYLLRPNCSQKKKGMKEGRPIPLLWPSRPHRAERPRRSWAFLHLRLSTLVISVSVCATNYIYPTV